MIVIAIANFGNTMQNMLTMQTNSATVIAVCLKGNCLSYPFPTTTVAMFLDPKLVKWKSSGNVKMLLNTSCSIQGARFLSSDYSRSTMKQDCFSLCLTTAYLCIPGQLSIADSLDTVKISKRFACANELSK